MHNTDINNSNDDDNNDDRAEEDRRRRQSGVGAAQRLRGQDHERRLLHRPYNHIHIYIYIYTHIHVCIDVLLFVLYTIYI